jgi:uncharacterized protein YgfB (UPF0149 family)
MNTGHEECATLRVFDNELHGSLSGDLEGGHPLRNRSYRVVMRIQEMLLV